MAEQTGGFKIEVRVKVGDLIWLGGSCWTCGRRPDETNEWRQYQDVRGEIDQLLHKASREEVDIHMEVRRVPLKTEDTGDCRECWGKGTVTYPQSTVEYPCLSCRPGPPAANKED